VLMMKQWGLHQTVGNYYLLMAALMSPSTHLTGSHDIILCVTMSAPTLSLTHTLFFAYVQLYICPICVPGPYKVAQESEALVNYVRTLMRPPPPAEASLVLREISWTSSNILESSFSAATRPSALKYVNEPGFSSYMMNFPSQTSQNG
jgi:hypothetical protein